MYYEIEKNYLSLCDEVKNSFIQIAGIEAAESEKLQFKLYSTVELLIIDLSTTLNDFYSHKPKLFFCDQGVSYLAAAKSLLYRRQAQVQNINSLNELKANIEQFDMESNFIVWSSENELTGEKYFSESERLDLHQQISKKRVFSIEIKSSFSEEDKIIFQQSSYSLIVYTSSVFKAEYVLLVANEKMKAALGFAQYQKNENLSSDSTCFFSKSYKFLNELKSIKEKELTSGLLVKSDCTDRVFYLCKSVYASTLKQILMQRMGSLSLTEKIQQCQNLGFRGCNAQLVMATSDFDLVTVEKLNKLLIEPHSHQNHLKLEKMLFISSDMVLDYQLIQKTLNNLEIELSSQLSWPIK